jgi:heme iron utilization protein
MNATTELREIISANPGVVFEDAAREHMCRRARSSRRCPRQCDDSRRARPSSTLWSDISSWGDVTIIVHTEDGIMEFGGPIPKGQVARGYFNLMGRTGFHGHLRHERCAGIAFVERPFMGRTSCLLVFLNADGGIMFKVFVGRDESGELKADQLEKFRALRDRICA